MRYPMNRRDLLRGASALLATGSTFGCGDHTTEPGPFAHATAPAGQPLRISLNVYSFNRMLNDYIKGRGAGTTLLALIKFCQDNKFDAIDPTGYFWWDPSTATPTGYPNVPPDSSIDAFRKEAEARNIAISGTGIRNNFASPYSEVREADLRTVKAWCEVAAKMGAPVLRVFAGPTPSGYAWDDVTSWMVDCLSQCAEWGKEYGVIIGVQNHGDMMKTADHVINVVRRVNSPWFGAINDTGYFLTPNPYDDIARVMPYTVSFQVKESVRAVKNFTAAWTSLVKLARIIRKSGYQGFLPVETLEGVDQTPPYDAYSAAPKFRDALATALEQTAPGQPYEFVDPPSDQAAGT